jgi:hybrid cluster-associated redox disulfide protein
MTAGKPKIDKEMNIGEILDKYPEAREIFQKHFGQGCFNCPGSRLETIYFGALMHNKDVNEIVRDLNAKIKV